MSDSLPGSDNSGDRRRTSLLLRDQRPADGFHQKLIVHRRAFIQPQTLLPALIRKFYRFITVTLIRLPALKPNTSIHDKLIMQLIDI